ncbi:MAG: Maf family protein [Sciscionella sp.]
MRFILASASPARLAVLRAAGIDPIVRVSNVDEDAVAAALSDPRPDDVVSALAVAKADAVLIATAAEHMDSVIVGCDSMLSIDGELVGKPLRPEVALRRWRSMAGGTGDLLTGHAVIRIADGTVVGRAGGTQRTTVHFGRPTEHELAAYVEHGEPLHVAGGFTIDGLGGWFVERISGDPSSVIGISLPLMRTLLAKVGLTVADLWQHVAHPR